jgi:hypothetical protein
VTDEPKDKVLSDQTKPVTSSVRTASDFIAAAGRNKENNYERQTSRSPLSLSPVQRIRVVRLQDHDETRVDVTGVGGVQHGTNEEASKADAQVDVSVSVVPAKSPSKPTRPLRSSRATSTRRTSRLSRPRPSRMTVSTIPSPTRSSRATASRAAGSSRRSTLARSRTEQDANGAYNDSAVPRALSQPTRLARPRSASM